MVRTFASRDISAVLAAEAEPSSYTLSGAGSPWWMAPELSVPEAYYKMSGRPTFESDIFSFGMLIYEVFQLYSNAIIAHYFYGKVYSGLVPFQDDTNILAVFRILEGPTTTIPNPRLDVAHHY